MKVSIEEACTDPRLLGSERPWKKQLQLLGQLESGGREHLVCWGRRSGKTATVAKWIAFDACCRDLTMYHRKGEVRFCLCIATNREQARIPLAFVRQEIQASPLLRDALIRDAVDELEVVQPESGAHVIVRAMPCSSKAARGYACSTLAFDELSHFGDDGEGPAVASRIYSSLLPTVSQFRDAGRVISISTPNGRSGKFWELAEMATSGEFPEMNFVHSPTWDVNEALQPEDYERERKRDPIAYMQEFGAEFVSWGSAFLPSVRIEDAIDDSRYELPPGEITGAVAAFDPGLKSDDSALCILGRSLQDPNLLRVAVVRHWSPPDQAGSELELLPLLDEVARICADYGVRRLSCDQHYIAIVKEHLRAKGIYVEERVMSAASKSDIYSALKARMLAGQIELFREPRLIDELGRLEAVHAAGKANVRIARVGSSHGDCAQALALCVSEFTERRSSVPHMRRSRRDDGMFSAGLMERDF